MQAFYDRDNGGDFHIGFWLPRGWVQSEQFVNGQMFYYLLAHIYVLNEPAYLCKSQMRLR